MKKTNLILSMVLSIIVLIVSNCANTAPAAGDPVLAESQQDDAAQRGLPAPPGLRSLFQSGNNAHIIQEGIVINGVEWAASNVDRDGAFVNKPEDSGWTYQWNSARPEFSMAQSTAGLLPLSFFTQYPAGNSWEISKDPSPDGWRVPTQEEISSLLDTGKVTNEWTTLNGIAGRKFTDRSSGENIFIPAAGKWFADIDSGERTVRKMDIGTGGYYWTATAHGDYGAVTFEFNLSGVSLNTHHRTMTFMIRPVKDR